MSCPTPEVPTNPSPHKFWMRQVFARTYCKKQAEKNAAMVAWASLKQLVQCAKSSEQDLSDANEEQLQKLIAQALLNAQKDSDAQISPPQPQPQPPPSQSRTEIPRAETKQRVRIIPLLQNSEKGSSPSNDCLNENKGSYGLTFDRQNIMSRENSCAASGWVVNQPSGMVGQIPLQIHGMPMVLGPESHVTVFSANQMQRDYEQNNWFQAGPSTVMLVNNANDLNVSDTGFPFVPTAYNQMIVTPGNHHWMGMLPPVPQVNPHPPTFKPALSLAPRVRVRRAVPVCSAPPPLPEEDITETKEVASLQALNQLRL